MTGADEQIRADRATLVDFIHNEVAACDAAAERLAASPREADRQMAAEWRDIRLIECVRPCAPAEQTLPS